jgi:hypothetical protein
LIVPSNFSWKSIVPEPSNKVALEMWRTHFYRGLKYDIGRTQPSLYVLDKNIATIPWYMMMPKKIPYARTFMDKIDRMLASGLIQRWHAHIWMIIKDEKTFIDEIEPEVLTIEHLRLGFLCFSAFLVASCCVFLIEIANRAFTDAFVFLAQR